MCEYIRPTDFVDFSGEENKYLPQGGGRFIGKLCICFSAKPGTIDANSPKKSLAQIMNLIVGDY